MYPDKTESDTCYSGGITVTNKTNKHRNSNVEGFIAEKYRIKKIINEYNIFGNLAVLRSNVTVGGKAES